MKLLSRLALYKQKMMQKMIKTWNEIIFDSFKRDRQKKGGEKDVKLNRIKEKLWYGRSQLPKHIS